MWRLSSKQVSLLSNPPHLNRELIQRDDFVIIGERNRVG